MAEPQGEHHRAPDDAPALPDASPGPVSPPLQLPEPTDDSPTIISKASPRAARPEETFPSGLRGRQLAHFELIEAIGVGGMAAVIRARDTQLDRPVALKILPPEMAVDPENVRRFHQEARAAAKLDHENIARVFFCGEDQGLHFIAFEFVDGDNLRTIIERRRRLPIGEAVHYVLQVATGLAHAAERGVVHRDIKPSNIIVSSTGRAKLVDMGLARSLEPQSDAGLTQSGVTLGTFDYISPEQALEPREADVRSDIYSLGCTFYHMLTGRPPVPEGTAAKKLHHHQQVPPPDPRQLNAEIPDELAAILAHMMAKDPKHRYQRAEHLVQHLLQLAKSFGGNTEVPDGVLYVDTALPAPPRPHGFLIAAAALILLAVIVVGQGIIFAPPPVHSDGSLSEASTDITKDGSTPASNGTGESPHHPEEATAPPRVARDPSPVEVGSARDLAQALKMASDSTAKTPVSEILLTGDINLTKDAQDSLASGMPGLVYPGGAKRKIVIRPKQAGTHVVIRLDYDPEFRDDDLSDAPIWTALAVQGGQLELQDIRFVINATQAEIDMSAVRARGNAMVTLRGCEFIQDNPPTTDANWMTSVAATERSRASLQACYFGIQQHDGKLPPVSAPGHQEAITLEDGASVAAEDCAFVPHRMLFHFRKATAKPVLKLIQCTMLVSDGPAIQVESGAGAQLEVHHCLFSSRETSGGMGPTSTLIHQTGEDGSIRFTGNANRYYNLSAFWTRLSAGETVPVASNWNDFQTYVINRGGTDKLSQAVTTDPWGERDPLRFLRSDQPGEAFALDARQPALRLDTANVVGVQRCSWGDVYGTLPPLEAPKPVEAVAKIVNPSAARSGNGVYRTLAAALEELQPGDEIHIRFTGLLPIKPVELNRATDDVTIKPEPGFRPILTLGDTTDLDAALFRLGDGKLRLEDLEFHLHPSRDEFTAQSVVDVLGGGQCTLKDCIATLEDPRGKPLAVVMLTAPNQVMKMETATPRPQPPSIKIDGCFVRGQGDLISVRATRPASLVVSNSLVALAGSFLNVEGNVKDPLKADPLTVQLNQVTAYLTDYLVWLRAGKDGRGPVPIQVGPASGCLFASAAEGKALIHLDGLEAPDFRMKHQFSWEGQRNVYSKFQPLLDQRPKGEDLPMQSFDQQQWKTFTNETDGTFASAKFVTPPDPDPTALVKSSPAQFRIKSETGQPLAGADVDRLPRPAQVKDDEK